MSSLTKTSKYLCYILRHKPETIELTLDANGWADIDDLIVQSNKHKRNLDRHLLEQIVATDTKNRYAISEDGRCIRANQGHSADVDLELPVSEPPPILYHGTATRFIDSIKEQGLIPGTRKHVHLSFDMTTAHKVGQRHGKPVVLRVKASEMVKAGHEFFVSVNGVWLTKAVPVEYIDFLDNIIVVK